MENVSRTFFDPLLNKRLKVFKGYSHSINIKIPKEDIPKEFLYYLNSERKSK